MSNDGTKLGDYCKALEAEGTDRVFKRNQGIMVRLDGRSFHSFTRGLDKPYDLHLIGAMQETAVELVKEFNPVLAYWQSDEITLYWNLDPLSTREYPFGGKAHKLTSVLAGMASSVFMRAIMRTMPAKVDEVPHFDGRAFAVPNARDAYRLFLWRHRDALRNAIQAFGQATFGHKKCLNKNTQDVLRMLFEDGIVFEDAPLIWRNGEFLVRQAFEESLTDEELANIPEKNRPAPGTMVHRTRVVSLTADKRQDTLKEVAQLLVQDQRVEVLNEIVEVLNGETLQ